ncbi:molybdopterin molybdenumtransferase MoeA, partial [bacterium]|nr:molybdopterin molybdenumtransferase MoeA [bacterium]
MQIHLTEAQERLDGAIAPVGSERAKTTGADGRWLAAPALAAWGLPRESVSAMDGWAVDSEALVAATSTMPVLLPQGEPTHAGGPRGELPEGGCAWVATGAAVPRGATAVVPTEDTEEEDGGVRFRAPAHRGKCIRVAGEDLAAGDRLAAAGERLTPWVLQALLTAG